MRPTPTAQLEARGSWRAKTRGGEPQPEIGAPPKPGFLLPLAAAEWDRVVSELVLTGVLAKIDLAVLAAYCQCFAHWQAAEEWMKANGTAYTLRNDKGEVKSMGPVPQFGIAQKSLEKMLRFAAELGLSPAARAKIKTSEVPPEKEAKARFFKAV